MKIWFISDTHQNHNLLEVPKDIDMVIHSGDSTNYQDGLKNHGELLDFLEWYKILDIKYKVYIAGNHDTCIERGYFDRDKFLLDYGITYLEHSSITIEGINIFGSPFTPTFGFGWAFNKSRSNLYDYWEMIPEDTDILVTHGPPRGILDLTYDRANHFDVTGDRALLKRVIKVKPKIHSFGHIHNTEDIVNQCILERSGIRFINVSVVEDGRMSKLSSNGFVIDFNK